MSVQSPVGPSLTPLCEALLCKVRSQEAPWLWRYQTKVWGELTSVADHAHRRRREDQDASAEERQLPYHHDLLSEEAGELGHAARRVGDLGSQSESSAAVSPLGLSLSGCSAPGLPDTQRVDQEEPLAVARYEVTEFRTSVIISYFLLYIFIIYIYFIIIVIFCQYI